MSTGRAGPTSWRRHLKLIRQSIIIHYIVYIPPTSLLSTASYLNHLNVLLPTMGVTFSQFFPPSPSLTESNLPRQSGKVFLITGGYSGVGLELSSILYHAGAKVYIAGRSQEKAQSAISTIKARSPSTGHGELHFLLLDLSNLATIKPATQAFLDAEHRLDVLFNNAGVSLPPGGSRSAQGHELQMATNCLGHYLLTQLLLPVLIRTAEASPELAAVRVIWTSSIVVDLSAPKDGIVIAELTSPPESNQQRNYLNSKTGNWILAAALARQVGSKGILSVTQNPGNLRTGLLRHAPWILEFVTSPLLYVGKMGAYTAVWAGLSQDLRIEDGGGYIVPWGRQHPSPRPDLINMVNMKQEGGTGVADAFLEFCEELTRDYR